MKAVRDLDALQARIGYRFKNLALLEQALTHTTGARPSDGLQSYQRLEWLGDRVLGLAIAEALLAAFPDAAEGDMSIRFAELVRKETCAEVAIAWGVGPNIRLGAGEATSGVRKRVTVLGDACEAIVGAVFLDADYPASKAVVLVGWRDRLAGAAAIRPWGAPSAFPSTARPDAAARPTA
jgi:ribonuclease III